MNPVLVDSIRRRMREQTTERLLELWVTNDRVTWSAEAFEAVRSLLAERGVKELPPQNEPAPIAAAHQAADDPVAAYWMAWVRPILWICIVIAISGLPRLAVLLWGMTGLGGPRYVTIAEAWKAAGTVAFWLGLIDVSLPLLLAAGAVGALRLRAWSRHVLLTYAGAAAAIMFANSTVHLWQLRRFGSDVWLFTAPESLYTVGKSIAFPVILWLFLRRPEIRSLFTPIVSGSAFEPLPRGAAMPDPAAR